MRYLKLLLVALCLNVAACGDSSSGPSDPISGDWVGKFSNGIPIAVTLDLSAEAITGTFDTGDSGGAVTGSYNGTAFALQLTAATGTQRTLANAALIDSGTRITADWDDGAGQSGAFCLAKVGSTLCL